MGLYNTFLCNCSWKRRFNLVLCTPLKIKRSLGMDRGKSDKIDALRIARYGKGNFKDLAIWQPPDEIIQTLKYLTGIRRRILKAREVIGKIHSLEDYYLPFKSRKIRQTYYKASIDTLSADLRQINDKIRYIIDTDMRLKHLYELVTSVPGIGKVVATQILITTHGFQKKFSAKSFASYCGIAPFPWESGTSIKGTKHVSTFANRRLKSLLHIAAMVVIRTYQTGFMREYYVRKIGEGKNSMSIINAIRNKLVHRIFACVKADKKFAELKSGISQSQQGA